MSDHNTVRVRFAPSPSGYLHIGGARTAIFNWLFARKNKGKFLLRIEDTDTARSNLKLVDQITEALSWLGLQWDEDVLFQSQRIDLYRPYCHQLLGQGKAYRCFCSRERLDSIKDRYGYDGHCLRLSEEEIADNLQRNRPYALRLKIEDGVTQFKDTVFGSLKFNNDEIDDFVLLKSDGTPTYHMAVVVDDHEMGITHVIRGADHVSNTPKQVLIYQAFGWDVPSFTHVPLILGTDRKRLSKRHGATSVLDYREMGYHPEALFNFLALLGWSPGDNREKISRKEMIELFSLDAISKNNAIFDEKKLQWMNGQYISEMPDQEIADRILPSVMASGLLDTRRIDHDYLLKVIALFKQKVRSLNEFVELGSYFFKDPDHYDEAACAKYWNDDRLISWLSMVHENLSITEPFRAEQIEVAIRDLAQQLDISAAKLIHPIRLALTGYAVSPGLFEMMELLGQDTVLRRLDSALAYLK
ncbi:glutamate--tRNA ligase [candidate division KSB1 bacterium]|nr:glutamate--tRNA ligase [candidate division KSB1 bacterium]